MSIIEIHNLTRDYGAGRGIFDISIQVEKGEAFGFLGPNGAGKTTTIRHLMGYLRPKAGSCTIDGSDCWKERDLIQKNLGYIPGEISFFDDMTGSGFLRFLLDYRKVGENNRMNEMLERFGLDPDVKIRKMSKGMKQKTGIVAASMHDPDILILDEPTSGLDPLMQSRFVELIEEEKKKGKTILLSSHMFEEVDRTCDRVGIIRKGKLAAVDSVETLRKRHMNRYTVYLDSPGLAKEFAEDFDGEPEGNKVIVTAKQSLESVFMDYYGEEENDK